VLYSGDSSVDERRTGGKGARGDAFEKWLGGTRQRVKRGGQRGRVRVEVGEGGEEGGLARRLATTPDCRAWVTRVTG
jgi:hypothetical protein